VTDNDKAFSKLVDVLKALRAPGGCNWDRAQTTESLLPYMVEETYETVEAAQVGDHQKLKEGLGDVLPHIPFQAAIAEEKDQFDIYQVIEGLTNKMIERHPHVFGERQDLTPDQVRENWEAVKLKQRGQERSRKTVLSGVPKTMPALLKAFRVQEKAAQFGFDWENPEDVFAKIDEELEEFKQALSENDTSTIKEELGDLLFSLVNFARHVKTEPETCLNNTIQKFTDRFDKMEKALAREGVSLKEATLDQMEEKWQAAKKK
jgi:MazG family protein